MYLNLLMFYEIQNIQSTIKIKNTEKLKVLGKESEISGRCKTSINKQNLNICSFIPQ